MGSVWLESPSRDAMAEVSDDEDEAPDVQCALFEYVLGHLGIAQPSSITPQSVIKNFSGFQDSCSSISFSPIQALTIS